MSSLAYNTYANMNEESNHSFDRQDKEEIGLSVAATIFVILLLLAFALIAYAVYEYNKFSKPKVEEEEDVEMFEI